jgi:hypothetical protein
MTSLTLLSTAVGCRLLPAGRINPGLDPRTLGAPGSSTTSAATPPPVASPERPAPNAALADRQTPPLPPLEAIPDREVEALAAATPLLDANLARVRNQDTRIEDATPPVLTRVPDPPTSDADGSSPAPEALQAVVVAMPGPEPSSPAVGVVDPGVTPASFEMPVVSQPASLPASVEAPVVDPDPARAWADGLDALRRMARERASAANEADPGRWSVYTAVLDWMSDPATGSTGTQHPLWPVALSMLAGDDAPTTHETPPAATDLRSAVAAIEGRIPFGLTELQFCRKVRSFGNYDLIEAPGPVPGQVVTIYCEVEGLKHEPVAEGFRSVLVSSLEFRRRSDDTVAWSLDLGRAEDVCRKPRRDYYINYRITLPPSSTLPPGDYRAVLSLEDVGSGRKADRAVEVTIRPAPAGG